MIARCQISGCHSVAAIVVINPRRHVCTECARLLASQRFPRAAVMLQLVAIAEALRQAANDLDELAGAAPLYELGALRRKGRGIVMAALSFADSFEIEN